MKLAVITIHYNDLKGLIRLSDSISNLDWITIDGRFTNFSRGKLFSIPSVNYLVSLDNTINLGFIGTETEKRNHSLRIAESLGYDFVLIVDSDEYFTKLDVGNLLKCLENLPDSVYSVKFQLGENETYHHRLYRPDRIEYITHSVLKDRITGEIIKRDHTNTNDSLDESLILTGNDKLRTPEYLKECYDYQEKLHEEERIVLKSKYGKSVL